MVADESPDEPEARAWSRKVNAGRVAAEVADARLQQDAAALFEELFGPADPALQAQIHESMQRVASLGEALLQAPLHVSDEEEPR